MNAAPQTVFATYVKVPGCMGLYRHSVNDRYYAVKKVNGKRKERSLETTDRKIAERRMKEWIADLGKVDSEVEKTTLKELTRKLIATKQGMSESSRNIVAAVVREFEAWWPYGMDFQVRNMRASHLEEWLANLAEPVSSASETSADELNPRDSSPVTSADAAAAPAPAVEVQAPTQEVQAPAQGEAATQPKTEQPKPEVVSCGLPEEAAKAKRNRKGRRRR